MPGPFKLKEDKLNRDFRMPSETIPPESEVAPKDLKKARNAIIKGLWEDMGIAAWKRNGEFEKTAYGDADNRFRTAANQGYQMFELKQDGTSKNPFKEPDMRVDSDEFVKKVQQGKIFAFPAGQKHPSQLQLVDGKLQYSRPLENLDQIPAPQRPQEPRRPGFFARMMHGISNRFFRQTFENYNAAMERHNAAMERYTAETQKLQQIKQSIANETQERVDHHAEKGSQTAYIENVNFLEKELASGNPVQDYVEPQRRAEERAAEQKAFDDIKGPEFKSTLDKKVDAMMNYYSPNPKRIESFTKEPGTGKAGPYTKAEFDQLETINIKEMKVGGKQVTDEQFAALGIAATMREDIGGNVLYTQEAEESHASHKDWAIHHNTMYTSDLFMNNSPDGPKPRDNVGAFFSTAIQPGRKYAKEALDEYQQGKPEKLGGLIAEGIKTQVNFSRHDPIRKHENLGVDVAIGKTMELLENDSKLMEEAKKAGVTDADLNALKGAQVLADVSRENERAETLLNLDTQSKHMKLSGQERNECIQSRLRYEAVNKNIEDHIAQTEKKPEYEREINKINEKIVRVQMSPLKATDTLERQRETERKIAPMTVELSVFQNTQIGVPEVFSMAGAHGEKVIDSLTETYLPSKDKLQNLQGKDLQDALDPKKLFADKSPYREQPAQEVKPLQKVAQRTVQKNVQKGGIEV